MTDALFVSSLAWLAGSIILLWRVSLAVLAHRSIVPFLSFFLAVIVMDTTAAFIYYGAWVTDTWGVIRVLWLFVFLAFFIEWVRMIKVLKTKEE